MIEISCSEVKQQLDAGEQFLLLDCREQNEYDHVHIAGCTLLPLSEIQQRVSELEPHRQTPIVVYCHHGGRSLKVTRWLLGQGYQHVRNMTGGIDAWATDIDPTLPRY